jgi:hypothetical protein
MPEAAVYDENNFLQTILTAGIPPEQSAVGFSVSDVQSQVGALYIETSCCEFLLSNSVSTSIVVFP